MQAGGFSIFLAELFKSVYFGQAVTGEILKTQKVMQNEPNANS